MSEGKKGTSQKSVYERGSKCRLNDRAITLQKIVGDTLAPFMAAAKDKEILVIQALAVDAVCMAGCRERIRRMAKGRK